jgi:Ca-activated chloride channel homolog
MTHRGAAFGKFGILAVLSLLLPVAILAMADHPNWPSSDDAGEYRISVQVGLVVLPVFVTNREGQAVSGLNARNFHLYEDGHPRPITLFEPEDVPATVGLVVDNSGSMWTKRAEVIAAGLAFAKSSNPQDQMFVVNFNQNVSLGLPPGIPFTSNVQQLDGALSRSVASGNTALYDGIAAALEHIKAGTRERKALIVVSDGGDNSSQLTLTQLMKHLEASNVVIHTIGIFDANHADENPGVLRRIAKVTGGNAYFPASASEVSFICHEIAQDIRHQYTLGYTPTGDSNAQFHAIRVTARVAGQGGLRVRTRAGYVFSSQDELPDPPDAGGVR